LASVTMWVAGKSLWVCRTLGSWRPGEVHPPGERESCTKIARGSNRRLVSGETRHRDGRCSHRLAPRL